MTNSAFTYVAYIRTTPAKLWHALTTPELMKRYWFGVTIESDWKAGSAWKMCNDGSVMDSGEILESVPQKRLVMKWLNEWKSELKAEGYSKCILTLEPLGTAVKLSISHSIERADSKFIVAVSEGWPMVVSNLKSLLENGELALEDHPGHG